MLTGCSIVVFSDDWGRHPSSCQHLIKQLLPDNRVLWVNTIGMRSPRLSAYDIGRSVQILRRWAGVKKDAEPETLPENLTVVAPVIIPYNQLPLVRRLNRLLVRHKLLSVMSQIGMKDPIVMTTFPCTCDYVGMLGERSHIYYCVDDFTNWPDVDKNLVEGMEQELMQSCDLILVTAEHLRHTKSQGRPARLLSHGVDFDRFNSPLEDVPLPDALLGVPKPIIGFFGALSAWLDFGLIAALASARPRWSFVFIGPVDTDVSQIADIPNVHLVGKVPYENLPRIASCFDVGIIPFQENELTRSVNPLKLLEYLSLGLPVVSSYMPEVERFQDVVTIARGWHDFLAALDRVLAHDTPTLRQQRIEKARGHSWRAVAERFSEMVNSAMTGDGRRPCRQEVDASGI